MEEQPQPTTVETTEVKTGVTKFGFGQIGNDSPKWSTWFFRIFFYLTSTISLGLTIFTTIPPDVKLQIMEGITFANLAIHGLSKMVGVEDNFQANK